MVWKPDVTVAAVIERSGRFLLVEERIRGRLVLNQPAGHLEDGERLLDAVVRETLEETAWHFTPECAARYLPVAQPARAHHAALCLHRQRAATTMRSGRSIRRSSPRTG